MCILLLIYIILDPFMVIHSYNDYFAEAKKRFGNNASVGINTNVLATMALLKNTTRPNSYIFGNSRASFYRVSDWKSFLPSDAVCFHFDGSNEPLWAVQKKVDFLDKMDINIDNALLIVDIYLLEGDKPNNGHMFAVPPLIVNNDNIVNFHKSFFYAFCDPVFLYAYFDLLYTKTYKPYMRTRGFNMDRIIYDVQTNERTRDLLTDINAQFYERGSEQTYYNYTVVKDNQASMLKKIRAVFDKHNTSYKIIINPLYDQKKLDEQDLNKLRDIFGEKNVYDFSGINDFTNDFHNYYETSHYRPHVAREILTQIYR